MALNGTISVTGGAVLTGSANSGSAARESWDIGSSPWDAIALALTDGTGNQQGNQQYVAERTLTAGSSDDLDLAGGLTNGVGATITFTKVKLILVTIETPDGTKKLQVGPGAASNPFLAGFGATGDYHEFFDTFLTSNLWAGWTVTAATADIFRIKNSSAVSVTYRVAILGVG